MWEAQSFGSVWLFSVVPWWLVLIGFLFLSTGMVLILRLIHEGKCYDRARSSTPGDLFLTSYCATIACFIQSIGVPKNGWHNYWVWHLVVFVTMTIVANLLHFSAIRRGGAEREFTNLPAQMWHNLIVVPWLGYAIVSTLPIVVVAGNPTLDLFPDSRWLCCINIIFGFS